MNTFNPQIFFLPDIHPGLVDTLSKPALKQAVQAARAKNEAFIRQHYQPGDRILVEEDCTLFPEEMCLHSLPGLDRSRYKIQGWIHPDAASKFKGLQDIQRIYQRAYFNAATEEDQTALIRFVQGHQHPSLDLPSNALAVIKAYFPLSLDLAQQVLISEVWGRVQTFLEDQIACYAEEKARLFIVSGPLHIKALLPLRVPFYVHA